MNIRIIPGMNARKTCRNAVEVKSDIPRVRNPRDAERNIMMPKKLRRSAA